MRTAKWLVCLVLVAGVIAGLGLYYRSTASAEEMDPEVTGGLDECPGLPVAHQIMMANSGEYLNQVSRFTNDVAGNVPPGMELLEVPEINFIDEEVFGAMRRDNIPSTGLSSDAEFIRRVYLDTTGRIPPYDDVRAFTESTDRNKRAVLIDRLLKTEGFTDRMVLFFGDLLRNSAAGLARTGNEAIIGRKSRNTYHAFLQDALSSGMPYDQLVTRLITASGNSETVGEADFIVRARQGNVGNFQGGRPNPGINLDTLDNLAVQTARVFLGVPLECIGCHAGLRHLEEINNWLVDKRRSDLWRMSAFFSGVRMTPQQQQRDRETITQVVVSEIPDYEGYRIGNNNPPGQPKPPDGGLRAPRRRGPGENNLFTPRYLFNRQEVDSDYRATLASLIVSDPQFAKATVNYIWKLFFGVGIVDPPDAFDLARQGRGEQPANPELLNALAEEFVNNSLDLRWLVSTILNSSTYQLSAYWQNSKPYEDRFARYFARHLIRRASAEQIHDSILQATGTTVSYDLADFGTVNWAHQLPDPAEPAGNNYTPFRNFLNAFERGNRNRIDRPEPRGNLEQVMALMNRQRGVNDQATNAFIAPRIRYSNTASLVRKLVDDEALTNAQVVDRLFITNLSRMPSTNERDLVLRLMDQYADDLGDFEGRKKGTEDLAWALINKLDFLLY